MLTADLAGCAAGVLDDAVAYVQDRRQFGVPVGSFQAVQHLAAGAFVLVEAVRSSLLFATRGLDGSAGASSTRDALVANIPVARIGLPEDIWVAVKFVLECDYFNGRTIDVDGGLAM